MFYRNGSRNSNEKMESLTSSPASSHSHAPEGLSGSGMDNPRGISKRNIVQMQRVVGNRNVQRMMGGSSTNGESHVVQRVPDEAAVLEEAAPLPAAAVHAPPPVPPRPAGLASLVAPAPAAAASQAAAPVRPPLPPRPARPAALAAPAPAEAASQAAAPVRPPVPPRPAGLAALAASAPTAAAPQAAAPVRPPLPPRPARPAAAPAAAAPQAAAPARPQSAKDLRDKGQYYDIYKWLRSEAEKDGKATLFGFFDNLNPAQKVSAIQTMSGKRSPDVANVESRMKSGIFKKSMDWDRFSEIVRETANMNTRNYNADETRDYVSYTAIGSSAAAGSTSGGATVSDAAGAGGALSVAGTVAPISGGLSGIASVSQIYNATQNFDSSLSAADQAQLVVGEGGGGAADLSRFTANTVDGVGKLTGAAANGAATVAAGVGAIAGGAAYLVGGVAGYRANRRNADKLETMESQFNENAADNERSRNLGLAAGLGASTQRMNQSKNAATATKGAFMIAGGAALLIAATSPAGPILLAAAAILGGVAAIIKFYKKYKRKEAFVDKALSLDQEMSKPENAGLSKEKVRQKLIESHGFNSVGQCYTQIVTDLSTMLFEGGVMGDDEECRQVIEGMGMTIDKAKRKPSKDLIAKKLHT